jgi:hypothetical protein
LAAIAYRVAVQETGHLAIVSNLLTSLGAAPHFDRSNSPQSCSYDLPDYRLDLLPFSDITIERFIYLERPQGAAIPPLDTTARCSQWQAGMRMRSGRERRRSAASRISTPLLGVPENLSIDPHLESGDLMSTLFASTGKLTNDPGQSSQRARPRSNQALVLLVGGWVDDPQDRAARGRAVSGVLAGSEAEAPYTREMGDLSGLTSNEVEAANRAEATRS